MNSAPINLDVLILGGGIAGLWTLAHHRAAGINAALIEAVALGAGQTLWSQGIIHGGIKYALTGEASAASKAIADMPAAWRAALANHGPVHLAAARTLAHEQTLWTTPGIVSRLSGLAASKAIRTPVRSIPLGDRSGCFTAAPRSIDIYSVGEPVLDGLSVITALASPYAHAIAHATRIISIERAPTAANASPITVVIECCWPQGSSPTAAPTTHIIHCQHLILAAGAGNEHLLTLAPIPAVTRPTMQRRPLHMVYAHRPAPNSLPTIFGHCLAASSLPRLTITSFPDPVLGTIWSLGGTIAESGLARSAPDQARAAHAELAACLPWLDLQGVRFHCARIDRAEGLTPSGHRPDGPIINHTDNITTVWPTKLAFAPLIADRLLAHTRSLVVPLHDASSPSPLASLPRAQIAVLPWQHAGTSWLTMDQAPMS